jgi:transcription elongation factor Elf1
MERMPTAIVTITCPNCGGKVEGIEATESAQTISCTYCKTELHVPRVGDEIVRETKVIHEIREVPVETPVEPLRARPKHPSASTLRPWRLGQHR